MLGFDFLLGSFYLLFPPCFFTRASSTLLPYCCDILLDFGRRDRRRRNLLITYWTRDNAIHIMYPSVCGLGRERKSRMRRFSNKRMGRNQWKQFNLILSVAGRF